MAGILIIDDDADLRALVRSALERAGHSVRGAADGGEGIRMFREIPADLVITDLIMPGKEGIETIRDLKEEFPGVRILAVSGGGSVSPAGLLTDATLFGADAALAKPFEIAELREAVVRLLAGE